MHELMGRVPEGEDMQHSKVRKRLGVVLSAAAMLLAATACGDDKDSGSAGGSDPISIGWVGDQSGPLATFAGSHGEGVKLYFDQLNADGGIDGHRVRLTALDDGSDPVEGVAAVKQLIDSNQVNGLIVPTSSTVQAAADIVDGKKVPMITPSVSEELLDPVRPMIFGGDALFAYQANAIAQYLADNPTGTDPERVGVIALDTAALASFVTNVESKIAENGWTDLGNQKVALTASTAASQATAIAAKDPTAIIMAMTDPFAISAVQTLRSQGFTGPIFNYSNGSSPPLMEELADPAFYVVRSYPYSTGADLSPALTAYAKAAAAAGVEPDGPMTLVGYVNAFVMTQGLKECGYPCSGPDLAKALEGLGQVDTEGLTSGDWTYSPDSHKGIDSTKLFVWDPAMSVPASAGNPIPLK